RGRRAVVRSIILLMQQDGFDEDGAYSQLRRESMRARQSLEFYCEDFLNRRARPPDDYARSSSVTLQDGEKQAKKQAM
ncbi:ANTAR domain-containing protein, partial [Lactobacillus crispatus]